MQDIDSKHDVQLVEQGDHLSSTKNLDLQNVFEVNATEKALTTIQGIKKYRYALCYAFFLSLGALLSGMDSTIVSGVLALPNFRQDMGDFIGGQYVVSAAWQSAWNGVGRLVQLIGALSAGFISDRIGRKYTVAIACCISVGAVFIQVFLQPHGYVQLLFGRCINNFAGGILNNMASSYTSEVSPLPIRGLTTGGVNQWIVIGQFLANCIVYGCSTRTDSWAYRLPYATQWITPTLMAIALPLIPESPWHLVRKGKLDKARRSLEKLYYGSGENVDQHLARIQEITTLEMHNRESVSFFDIFRGSNLRRTVVSSMTFVCQEMAGVQFVLAFSTYFFELAGFPVQQALQLGIGTLALALVGNGIGLALINRVGRRPLFFWGMIACTLDCLGLGICSLIPGQSALWGQAAFTMIYMLAYQSGIGPVAYALYAELSSAKLRTKTIAWGIMVNQFFVGVTQVFMPYLVNPNEANLQGKVGWIFFGIGVVASIWAWFFVPETMGRNVDEIDELFNRGIPMRKFHKTVLDNDRSATWNARI